MAKPEEDYKNTFHNLEGVTLKEKTKNLYIYLKRMKGLNQKTIESILLSIKPTTYLEHVFKVDMLVYFKRFPELIQVLKDDNVILINKVLKHAWIFRQIVEKMTPEQLVSETFAYVSFVTRIKVINNLLKYCKSEEYGDKLFDMYSTEYGMKQACRILPICSCEKVRDVLSSIRVNLSVPLLTKLVKKDPNLLLHYLTRYEIEYGQSYPMYKYRHILKHIAVRDVKVLWEIFTVHHVTVMLSRRDTHRFIKAHKQQIISDPSHFVKVLDNKQLTRTMAKDFEKLYLNYFPANLNNIGTLTEHNRLFTVIDHLKKTQKMNLFLKTFTEKFKVSLYERPEILTTYLLEMTDDVNQREKWLSSYPKNQDVDYIIFMRITESIPQLKDKLRLTADPATRGTLIRALVDTCKINNSMSGLLEIGKYIASRYRNDLEGAVSAFLLKMDATFTIEELGPEHWEYLNELLTICKLNRDRYFNFTNYLEKYLHHCYLNNVSLKEPLRDLLRYDLHSVFYYVKNLKFERECLLLCVELYPEAINDLKALERNDLELLRAILEYNCAHPDTAISLRELPRLYESLMFFDSENVYHADVLEIYKMLFVKQQYTPSAVVDHYWGIFYLYFCDEIGIWFLSHEAETFVDRLCGLDIAILAKIVSSRIFIWMLENMPLEMVRVLSHVEDFPQHINFTDVKISGLCRKYSSINIPNILIEKWNAMMESNTSDSTYRATSIKYFSILMLPDQFNNLITQYYPEDSTVDFRKQHIERIFEIQSEVCKHVRYLTKTSVALQALLKFCTGDYLKIALSSLYHLSYHIPENDVVPLVNTLNNQPISVRKHSLFLSSLLLRQKNFYDILTHESETEANPSMRKISLTTTYKYFCKNPSVKFWNLLKVLIGNLDINDKEGFELLIELKCVPKIYYPHFIEHIWTTLEANLEKNSKIDKDLKLKLLNKVDKDTMYLLGEEFCDGIVRDHFLSVENQYFPFFVKYLLYTNNHQHRLQVVFMMFEQFKTAHTHDDVLLSDTIQNFLAFFIDICLSEKTVDTTFLKEFEIVMFSLITQTKIFNASIKLHIMLLHFESVNGNYTNNFSSKVARYLDELEESFGFSVIVHNYQAIVCIINDCFTANVTQGIGDNKFLFVANLYNTSKSNPSCFISIKLLQKPSPSLQNQYEALLEEFKKNKTPVIEISLFNYIRNVK